MPLIAVVGATGNTGRATVKALEGLGEHPRCVVRSAEKAKEVLGPGADIAVADVDDRASLEKALAGVDRVFVVTGHNPKAGDQQINVIEAAKAAGATFILKVSGGRAVVGPDAESVVGRGHHAVEEALKASGLAWCLLRPGLFMQNTFAAAASIKNDGKIVLPFPKDAPLAFTDVRDTADVAARILREPEPHAGRTYELTGALTTYEEFARAFSEVLGKPVTYVAASLEAAEQAMKGRGMPDWLVGHMLAVARIGASGGFSHAKTDVIRTIAGREATTTRQFVQDHEALFR